MKRRMAEPEMQLDVATDWTVGSPIVISGHHHVRFGNRGTVLRFVPESCLEYTHLSSVSPLPDKPENYTTIGFRLSPANPHSTTLHLTVSGFPRESIFRHFDFYWRMTLPILRRFIENTLT